MAVYTDDTSTVVKVDDWLNEQSIHCIEYPLACCSNDRIRRRYLRKVLYKRLTIEELERRYQQVQSSLTSEEEQAIQQGINKFKSGWYVNAVQRFYLGTFYTPISPLFTALLWMVGSFPYCCFPMTSRVYYILCFLCVKDNTSLCIVIFSAILLSILSPAMLLIIIDILFLLCAIFALPFLILGLILLELALLSCGLCYYRCRRLNKSGVFALKWKLKLISSVQRQHIGNQTLITTCFDTAVDVSLPRVSLCQSIFRNRVAGVFYGIYWLTYGYGNIDSVEHLTAEEVQMYEALQQINPKV